MFAVSRPKMLTALSFFLSLPAAYYFIADNALAAVAFVLLSDASLLAAVNAERKIRGKASGFSPAIKIAIERSSDAAIFIGFALSGIVSRSYGLALLAAAIILPFWFRAIWKKNVRWMFHLAMIALFINFYYNTYLAA